MEIAVVTYLSETAYQMRKNGRCGLILLMHCNSLRGHMNLTNYFLIYEYSLGFLEGMGCYAPP